MDRDLIKKNVVFKSIITDLKRKFPFIIGFRLPPDYEDLIEEYETVVFLDLVISLPKFIEYLGNDFELEDFIVDYFKYNDELNTMSLKVPIKLDSTFPSDEMTKLSDVQDDIDYIIKDSIKKYSEVLDSGYQIGKSIVINNYIMKL